MVALLAFVTDELSFVVIKWHSAKWKTGMGTKPNAGQVKDSERSERVRESIS